MTGPHVLGELRLGSPQALAEPKALTTAAVPAEFDRCANSLPAQSARLFGTEEPMEAMKALLQKRLPSGAR
jgi:enoyl-CoA hydratase